MPSEKDGRIAELEYALHNSKVEACNYHIELTSLRTGLPKGILKAIPETEWNDIPTKTDERDEIISGLVNRIEKEGQLIREMMATEREKSQEGRDDNEQ